jgi:hypothetical protein
LSIQSDHQSLGDHSIERLKINIFIFGMSQVCKALLLVDQQRVAAVVVEENAHLSKQVFRHT